MERTRLGIGATYTQPMRLLFIAATALPVLHCTEHWVQRIHDEMDQTFCDPKIGYMHKATWKMDTTTEKKGHWKWARGWSSSHGEWKNYALLWHELVPHLVAALGKATHDMTGKGMHTESLRQLADQGDVYAFGIAQGHNMEILHDIMPSRRLFGFDSFQGLPAEDHADSKISAWKEGDFKARFTPQKILAALRVEEPAVFAKIFPGFFDKTLTPQLVATEGMRPAIFLDVDCDLHASTFSVLDWAFTQVCFALFFLRPPPAWI